MANHSPEAGLDTADTLRYDEINDTVSLVNTSDKGPGDECCAVYGRYPNGKLLYSYGFVIQNNPHRAIDLWTRVTSTISNAEAKQEILQKHELTREQSYDFNGTLKSVEDVVSISPSLLATIRVIQACDTQELDLVENAFRGEMIR